VSEEALNITRRWFETWNSGDLDAFIDLYAIDAEMTPPRSWVETERLKGQPAIRRFFEGLKEAWEGEDKAILRDMNEHDEHVIARMVWQVRGRTSGIDTHLDITNVNNIERGKIVRQRHYLDHAEALKAVGLEE
jgi:ketosteroid isomerase-like protein